MGYCPYECVVCGDIEDNGWTDKNLKEYYKRVNLDELNCFMKLSIGISVLKESDGYTDENGEVITFSLCKRCYIKFIHIKAMSEGTCLKMYRRRKLNGKYIPTKN